MREKALLIGAQAPHSGRWIPISEAGSWCLRIETRPLAQKGARIRVEVMDREGNVTSQPHDQIISGVAVRGHLTEGLAGHSVSVYLEEHKLVAVQP